MAREKRKVLILKSHSNSLKAVEVFLKNRELDFYSTSSLKEALAFLLKEKPRFFLMAADHPNKKIRQLPKLISKSFNTTILGFCENSNNASLFALQELNAEFVLYPPVSGPAIVRTLSRVEKEIETRKSVQTITEKISRYELTRPENPTELSFLKNDDATVMGELTSLFSDDSSEPIPANQGFVFIPSANVKINKAPENASAKIVAQIVQESMEAIRQAPLMTDVPLQTVGATSKLACMVVDAGETKGYLLVAFGDGRTMDHQFMESIRQSLMKHFETQGEDWVSPLIQLKPMEISTKEVEFLKWAQEQAQFMMTTQYGQSEVVAAFLPNDEIPSQLNPSVDAKMCEIFIDQIQAEKHLDFDLFVYLPVNNKYILYNKRGGTLYSDQKHRLMARGVTHMHLRREDVNAFYRFQAESYINSRMERHQEVAAA